MIIFNYENKVDARVKVCPKKLFVVLLAVSDLLRSPKRGLRLQINFRSLKPDFIIKQFTKKYIAVTSLLSDDVLDHLFY